MVTRTEAVHQPVWRLVDSRPSEGLDEGHQRALVGRRQALVGRARSIEEAILWHGGEGDASRAAYESLSPADQSALVAFVKSL